MSCFKWCAVFIFLLFSLNLEAAFFDGKFFNCLSALLSSKTEATVRVFPWLKVEFGKEGDDDRIIMNGKTVIFQGRVTRMPLYRKSKLPATISKRVTHYRYVRHWDIETTVVFGTDQGIFLVSILNPASGFGMFNYRGHPTITTFLIPGAEHLKYAVTASIMGLGTYTDIEEDQTFFQSPYAIVTIREGESNEGFTPETLRKEVSYLRETKNGYRFEIPRATIESWLVKAKRPPRENFQDAAFYAFGGVAQKIGVGDYSSSKPKLKDNVLTLTPQHYEACINLADPILRPPVELILEEEENRNWKIRSYEKE